MSMLFNIWIKPVVSEITFKNKKYTKIIIFQNLSKCSLMALCNDDNVFQREKKLIKKP